MTREEAIAKARKLLNLGQSENEHEAALALSRAQELLARFDIELAEMGQDPTAKEKYSEHAVRTGRKNIIHWRRVILGGIARANGCDLFLHGAHIMVCGKPSDIQRTTMLYEACAMEVERLSRSFCSGMGKAFANAFRMGAAATIAKAAKEANERAKREMQGKVSTTALMVIDNRLMEAKLEMNSRHRLGRPTSGGTISSPGAYELGRDAGRGVYERAGRRQIGG